MKTNSLDSQIHARISSFAAELSALVKQAALESVHAALGGTAPAAAKRSTTVAKRGPGRPKANGVVDADQILAHVRANPGVQSSEIASAFRLSVAEARDALTKLMASKAVRREGQKRGTRYFAGKHATPTATAPKAAKKKARRKLSPAAVAKLRANLAKARAARAAKSAKAK